MKLNRTTVAPRAALVLALSGAFAASTIIAPTAVYAAPQDDLQKQLDAAMSDLGELMITLNQAEAELGKTNYDLDQTKAQIAELEKQIAENEKKLGVARKELSGHMAASYKVGNADLLALVLSSQDFGDLISRVHYANKVATAEQQAIETVNTLQTTLAHDKTELEAQQTEQEKLLESQIAQQNAAAAAANEQQAYVDSLSDELKAALEAERQRQAEESRKRAEEAARQEAEKQQAQQQNQQPNNGGSTATPAPQPEQPSPAPQPDPEPTPPSGGGSSASQSQRQTAVNAGLSLVGLPYSHANNTSSGFDCNGLTNYSWAAAGVSIPYPSGTYGYGQFQWMKNSGRWVSSISQMQPGDLVFYSHDGGITTFHVALYIGGGQIVHAVDYARGIQVTDYDYVSGFCGGGSPI